MAARAGHERDAARRKLVHEREVGWRYGLVGCQEGVIEIDKDRARLTAAR
jgi:hypothetical protein